MITVFLDAGERTDVPSDVLERAVQATCAALRVQAAEISLALLGDPDIARLNQQHLGHEGPTDVLAFALYDVGEPPLGDVYVGVDQAARQAEEAGVGFEEELVRLVVHGTLHVLGFEHPDDPEERAESAMYLRQEEIVREVLRGDGAT